MKPARSTRSFAPNQAYEGMISKKGRGACHPPRNSVTAIPLKAHIPKYSAMKNSAYLKPEYSVRWPAISSLSASGRSKGERFDSASAEIMKIEKPAAPHGVKTSQFGTAPQRQPDWAATIPVGEREPVARTTGTKERSRGSS